jgi:hypothetical protein
MFLVEILRDKTLSVSIFQYRALEREQKVRHIEMYMMCLHVQLERTSVFHKVERLKGGDTFI